MGKKRVGTLYNKPVVEGDPNLITRNEILVKKSKDTILMQERGDSGDLSSITAGGGSELLYYKLKSAPVTLSVEDQSITLKTDKEIWNALQDIALLNVIFPSETVYNGMKLGIITNLGYQGSGDIENMDLSLYMPYYTNLLGDYKSLSFCIKTSNNIRIIRHTQEILEAKEINLNGDLQQQVIQILEFALEDEFTEELRQQYKILLSLFEPITKEQYEQQITK